MPGLHPGIRRMNASFDTEALITARNVGWSVGGQPVLSNIDMTVRRGEVVSVIGPNGAGKSTLLRVLMGVVTTATGSVQRKPGLRVGYVPQHIAIDPALPLSVERLLVLACNDRTRVQEALSEVGAAECHDKPVQTLSGGEFRRVLLARAILRDPDLLVLDEPLAGVDVSGQAELYRLIGRLRDRYRAGVLMVSHDLHLVMAETDHVICLNHHVCCAGHPEQVSRDPAYAELFGDAVAVYTHIHDHVHDGDAVVPLEPGGEPHHHG